MLLQQAVMLSQSVAMPLQGVVMAVQQVSGLWDEGDRLGEGWRWNY